MKDAAHFPNPPSVLFSSGSWACSDELSKWKDGVEILAERGQGSAHNQRWSGGLPSGITFGRVPRYP
jgi:hypothetical protein